MIKHMVLAIFVLDSQTLYLSSEGEDEGISLFLAYLPGSLLTTIRFTVNK